MSRGAGRARRKTSPSHMLPDALLSRGPCGFHEGPELRPEKPVRAHRGLNQLFPRSFWDGGLLKSQDPMGLGLPDGHPGSGDVVVELAASLVKEDAMRATLAEAEFWKAHWWVLGNAAQPMSCLGGQDGVLSGRHLDWLNPEEGGEGRFQGGDWGKPQIREPLHLRDGNVGGDRDPENLRVHGSALLIPLNRGKARPDPISLSRLAKGENTSHFIRWGKLLGQGKEQVAAGRGTLYEGGELSDEAANGWQRGGGGLRDGNIASGSPLEAGIALMKARFLVDVL
ncbi:uncharacterized protein LOC119914068 [Micropterus salmoides]|uniref:uncharacterized protein LOC119914068 n=1 Tax=Micropterus salmoides TaxID=27706 RepID=UPI0018ED617C|nr:uncharacterized protein LOC119914068 [Micropterus salmoides]